MVICITPEYTFGSPRYNTLFNYTSQWLDEDYYSHNIINGTYDKYWPCYALSDSDKPQSLIANESGDSLAYHGDLGIYLCKPNCYQTNLGSLGYETLLINSNLDRKTIKYDLYLYTKLNPGWSIIQSTVSDSFNSLVIRVLGTSDTTKQYSSITISNRIELEGFLFKKASIYTVKETKLTYQAINETNTFPGTSSDWVEITGENNVFNVDVFGIFESGDSKYMFKVSDPKREFKPELEKGVDDDLVCWNLSYYFDGNIT